MDPDNDGLDETNLYRIEPVGPRQAPLYPVVLAAAKAAIAALNANNLHCAVFGGLACKLFGNGRDPRDVDILVTTRPPLGSAPVKTERGEEPDTEWLKHLLAETDPSHFILKPSLKADVAYTVPWFCHDPEGGGEPQRCKVDLLMPGIMHLPYVDAASFEYVEGIPVLPFPIVLLQKLQAWDDHGRAPEKHKRERQHVDASDVRSLLKLESLTKPLQTQQLWKDEKWFSPEFQSLTKKRVLDFCWRNPVTIKDWKQLGLRD